MSINIRERFRERKFSFLYIKKKKKENDKLGILKKKKEDESIFKIILFSPLIFFGFIKNIIDHFSGENSIQRKSITLKKEEISRINIEKNIVIQNNGYIKNKTINETIKSKMSQNKTKNKQAIRLKSNTNISTNKISKVNKTENIKAIDNMEISIVLKIKKKINKLSNECDIIESEAYLIKKYGNDKNLLERATAIKKEIEVLEEKLSKIDKELNSIKENILIYPKSINDEDLVESIIKYKELISDIEQSKLPNKIKLLEEYKELTIKLEELDTKTKNLEVETNMREKELSERDSSYKEAKEKMLNLDEINDRCNTILKNNKTYLDELSSKIGTINKIKYTKYKLQGLNSLLSTSLKYIGLLSLTPLSGILPGIAAKTYATRKLVGSMYHSLHYEKQEKIVYSFENYNLELNNRISSISTVEENIDLALQDINNLKGEFRNKFLKYNLPEYSEAYKKIELLEQDVLNSRKKIYLIKNKLVENQKVNKETLTKVRKLNSNSK